MILVDANLLLHSVDEESPFHGGARDWLSEVLRTPAGRVPWESHTAFVRIATHPRASRHPLDPAAAWILVEAWLAAAPAFVPQPTDRHVEVLGDLVVRYRLSGNLIPDGHLAALAIEHGLAICSADTDFARFTELRWVNPLA